MKISLVAFFTAIAFALTVVYQSVEVNSLPHEQDDSLPHQYNVEYVDTQSKSSALITGNVEAPLSTEFSTYSQYCIELCPPIVDALLNGVTLNQKQMQQIKQSPEVFARYLSMKPEVASVLITYLFDDEDTELNIQQQDAVDTILTAMTEQQRLVTARALHKYPAKNDRFAALVLLSPLLAQNIQSITIFETILSNEDDPQILAKAINMVSKVEGYESKTAVMQGLSDVIYTHPSAHIRGTALLSKVSISPSHALIYRDVLDAVNNLSADSKAFGLEAVGMVLHQQSISKGEDNNWNQDVDLQVALERIADDTSVDIKLRSMALNLMDDYY